MARGIDRLLLMKKIKDLFPVSFRSRTGERGFLEKEWGIVQSFNKGFITV